MNIAQCLQKITEITKQNLEILQALNDSFFTKKTRLTASVGDNRYIIPSFISLENKINHLQDAFNNLVHAPETGEAWFNFDGNSRSIECRGYQTSPNPIALSEVKSFSHENLNLFKDMMNPSPYINVDLSSLPNDVVQVVVRKIVPYSEDLITNLKTYIEDGKVSGIISYGDLAAELESGDPAYTEGTDYLVYDSTYTLPTRKMCCSGDYVVTEVVSDTINDSGEEILTVVISEETPLVYYLYDGLTSVDLSTGDTLTTYDGSCVLKIEEIYSNTRKLVLRVTHSEYTNIVASDGDEISDYSKLRFYKADDFDSDKYLHIPLEEDEYVFVAVAPLNSRMNVQSSWGDGLFIHTHSLVDSEGVLFKTYYTENVVNIGDMVNELASIVSPPITKYTSDEYSLFVDSVPTLTEDTLHVVQINKHINDSTNIQNIRNLYSQKKQYNADLKEVENKISALTAELSEISFDDTSGTRAMYEGQISELKSQQTELSASITTIIDEISVAANDATIPLEDAKYRVRGYVDVENILKTIFGDGWEDYLSLVQDVDVQYRYKNSDNPLSNVDVINDFLFTEWSAYTTPDRKRTMSYDDGKYSVSFEDTNDTGLIESNNDLKFNQVDIPISQGEVVDIRARIVWVFGYPFVRVTSQWSDILTVEFPAELIKDVTITTIIEENNNDIETNRFTNILSNHGVTEHTNDAVEDQDVTYYHKPESISSGFYTTERRIIPLLDKLKDMDSILSELQDVVGGTTSESISVSLTVDNVITTLSPDIDNIIQLSAFSSVSDEDIATGTYTKSSSTGILSVAGTLSIANESDHTINLFSMFPASRSIFLGSITNTKYDQEDFYTGSVMSSTDDITYTGWRGQAIAYYETTSSVFKIERQRGNQFISWRRNNPYNAEVLCDSSSLYSISSDFDTIIESSSSDEITCEAITNIINNIENPGDNWVYACPLQQPRYNMCIDSDVVSSKITITSGEVLTIPILIYYHNSEDGGASTYTLAFNIRTSLYSDPLFYQFTLTSKYSQSLTDTLASTKASIQSQTKYNVSVR